MTHNLKSIVLSAAVCTLAGLTQVAYSQNKKPVAYVYVSFAATSSSNKIDAFAAEQNGKLTPVSGSPFAASDSYMAVNGRYLFGASTGGSDIDAWKILPSGALQFSTYTSVVQGSNCDAALDLFLDHTGGSLYNWDIYGNECANATFQSFAVNRSTGGLRFLNYAGASPELEPPLRFIGNNKFAYGASCYHFIPAIYGFRRNADGSLSEISQNFPFPRATQGAWCPYMAAADPTNHLVVPMYPSTGPGGQSGPYQLAVYTVAGNGNIRTSSTSSNMPQVAVGSVTDVNMAPSGRLVAVSGTKGVQVFHFNGGNPITPYTGLLTGHEIDQVFWDNDNHLYGISRSTGKLYVFRVTENVHVQAPGSPYSVSGAKDLIVQPLP